MKVQRPATDAARRRNSGDCQTIVDVGNPGYRPRGILNRETLDPIVDLPFQYDLVTILDGYTDCLRFDLRMPSEADSILLFTFEVSTLGLIAILFVTPRTPDNLRTSSSAARR
jgi:hypothetical protein